VQAAHFAFRYGLRALLEDMPATPFAALRADRRLGARATLMLTDATHASTDLILSFGLSLEHRL
jgi:hypothetical protein